MLKARAKGPRLSPALIPMGREAFTQKKMAEKPNTPIIGLMKKRWTPNKQY